MLIKDFQADADKDAAAHKFGASAKNVRMCEPFSRQQAKGRDDGTDHADQGGRPPYVYVEEREGKPHGQGVDTGRHREDEQLASFGGINRTAFPVFGIVSAAPDHVAADPCQQREGDPVIPRFDESAHGQAKGPSDHGHQELEKAERQRKAQKMYGRHPFEGAARTDRHGESIHGQCNGNGEQFWETHRVLWGLRLWASKPIRLL